MTGTSTDDTPPEQGTFMPFSKTWRTEVGEAWTAISGRREYYMFGPPMKVVRYERLERIRITVEFILKCIVLPSALWLAWRAVDLLTFLASMETPR